MDKNKELTEIKANLDTLDDKFKQAKADICCIDDKSNDVYYKCMDACYQMISSLRQYVYSVEDRMYSNFSDHNKGHLPKILGAEKMQNAIDTLGISQDYDVQKPIVWISASRNGTKNFTAELNIPKK